MSAATNCPASRLAKVLLLGFLLQGVLIGQLAGQITLSNTNAVSENFDSMGTNAAAVLPNGFKMTAAGQGTLAGWESLANLTNVNVQASSGSPTTGGRYNWGSSATERAAGFMTSGGYASPNGIMAMVVNNIGSTMTELNISFDVERYRINSAAASVSFFSSLDGSTWTSVPAGDTGAFPTNASSYTFTNGTIVSKTLSLSGLSVSNGGAVYLKWNFNTTGSSSQGLGLDNLALQAVAQSADAPVITSASTASAVGFTSFSYQITATQSPTSYSATGLPAGLSVDSSTGLVSGVPTEQGVFNVTISASNASGTGSAPLALTIAKNPGAPTITSSLAASGELFSPFTYQIVATDSPTGYGATNLHAGLTIDPATGLISGSPTVSGNRNIAISASNALGVDTQTLALFIGTSPVINPPTAASAYVNAAVSWQVSAAGPATSYSATGLPAGFSINTGTGLITGTAAATAGTSTFQVTASNALGSATQTMTLAVLDQAAQNAIPLSVVVNKYANSTSDQIQLLVVGNGAPGSAVDMRGMVIKDFSSSMGGDGGGKYAFADDPLWAAVPCGTFVALSAGATAAEDFDLSDFHVAVNLDNTAYFTNVGGVAMDVATTEMIMVKAAGTGALGVAGGIHCMGSGAAAAQFNAFLGAKLLGSGTTPAGFGAFASNATSALIDYGASGGAAATGATGNTAVGSLNFTNWNNASNEIYVLSLRGSSATPAIILNPASVTTLTAIAGSAGAGEPFQVSGANLTGNLTVTAPVSFEVSTTSATTGFGTTATITASGTLAATDVWVRIASTAPSGAIGPANVTVSGGGATTQNVSVSGTVNGSGPASIGLNPTSATNLVAFTGSPGTAQQIAVIGTNLPGTVNFAADSNEYEVASQGGNFGVAASLPASGGVALVSIKSSSTNGAVGAAQLVFESGSGLSKVTNSIPLNGTRISGGTGGLVPGLQTFANDLNFTATARFVWVLKSDTVIGRGTEFSGVNVGGNLGVSAGASFDVVLNGAGSSTDFSMDFWKSARSWFVFNVTGNTAGSFSLGAITPDSGGKYYAPYGSFGLRTDAGGDIYLDWTPSGLAVASISVSTPSLSLPSTTTNVAGASTNFTASGVNLTNNITVTAADALNFAVSTNSSSGFASSLILTNTGGTVAATPVYVRLTGAAAGSVNSVVSLVSGTTSNSVTVSGTVNLPGAATLSPSNNTALSGFATVRGTSSTNQTFTLSGSNLAAPITLTPPPGWQISATNTNNFTASAVTIATNPTGFVSNTAIYVRLAATNATATNYVNSILPLAVPGSLTNNVVLSGSVTDPTPVISRTPSSLSGFATQRGQASTNQSFTLSGSDLTASVTITPPAGWQISATNTNNFTASAVTIATNPAGVVSNTAIHVRLAGTNAGATNYANVVLPLVSAAASNNVLLSGAVNNPPPVLTADPASLTNFSAVAGTPSAVTNYSLTGSNLTTSVTVSAPLGFQVALTNTNSAFTNTLSITNNGSISNSIWVRVSSNALTNTNLTGSITNTAGALVTNVALQARVVAAPTLSAVPTALSNFSTITGIASTNQSFNLTASNLLGPVNLAVTNGYEISFGANSGYTNSLNVGLTNASDNAGNYLGGWTNGANGGTGFGPWSITTFNGTGFAGAFIGNPAAAGIATNAPFGTNAFGMFANPGGSGAFAFADRGFTPLQVGQTFSFRWAVNFDADAGNKGFNIFSGGTGGTQLVNVNQAGFPGNITINGTNTALAYGTNAMTWSFTMTSQTNLLVTSTGRDGTTNIAFATNIAVAAPPDSFRWYASGMGAGDQRQPYFNNLEIAYAGASITDLPIYVRLATNAPVAEATNSLLSRVTISSPLAAPGPALITYVGSETGLPANNYAVQNWSDTNVSKTYDIGGSERYGTAGYYQIRPTPTNSPINFSEAAGAGNNLGIGAGTNPTFASAPSFVISATGGAGSFVNFGGYSTYRGPNGSTIYRQGALSVSVNNGPFTSPAGNNASYYGAAMSVTLNATANFRIGLAVDSVGSGDFAPNYVSIYNPAAGTVFSGALTRDGNSEMAFFDVQGTAGDTFDVALWQNAGTQNVAALSLATFDATPNPAGTTNVFVELSGSVASSPVITESNSLVQFSAVQGFPSDPQEFKVGGINLLTNVLVTPPGGYEVSLDGVAWAAVTNVPSLPKVGVTTPQTNVFIRVAPTAQVGTTNGNIELSSTQASNVLIPVSRVVGADTGPQLVATPTVLPAFATDLGSASASNSFVLTGSGLSNSVSVAAPSGFEISTNNGTTFVSNSTLIARASGFLSNNIAVRLAGSPPAGIFTGSVSAASVGAVPAVVSVAGTVYADASAQIAATPLALSNFATTNGTPSASQSFLGSARNLATDLVATASGGYEVSTNNTDFFPAVSVATADGNVAPVAFHARISSNTLPANPLVGTVTLSSGAAPTTVVTLNGEVYPARPLSVVLTAPTNNPTIIAPGSSVRLSATVSDTNASGKPVQIDTFEFRTNNVAIPGAFVTNVTSPYTLTFDWTPSPTGLPAGVSAWAIDVDGWEGSSASVTVRFPDPGEPVAGFNPPTAYPTNSQIEAVAPATNGAFYIGGGFTNLVRTNGSIVVTNAATRVARILSDGTVDPEFVTETGPNSTVRTVLYSAPNQGLYIGGAFTNVSGVARPGLARLVVGQSNLDDGTLDANFAPVLAGVSAPVVNSLVQQYDGKILVGGIFTTAGAATNATNSANLARFLTNGVRDASFTPPAPNGEVKSVALQPDGKILIAGSFAQVAGLDRRGIARLNVDGTLDTTFNVGSGPNGGFNGAVWTVAVALDGSIYAGGQFSSFNGRSVYNNLAKLSSAGVLDARFNYAGTLAGGINNLVRNVQTRPGGGILVSGQFTQIANSVLFPTPVAVGRVAEFRPDGKLDGTFNPGGAGANNSVLNAATLANGNLVLVGAFSQYNGQRSPRIAVLAGASVANPVVTSPEFFTVDAGAEFDFPFTSSGAVPYDITAPGLPRGVTFDATAGKLSGIPLDAGAFDLDVSATKPGGGFGSPSAFRLQVLPRVVPYDTWKKVWFTPAEQSNSAVSGPAVSGGNPSGQPNFTVYALSGGDPRKEGPSILPEAAPTIFEGQRYMGYTVWRYPLAAASYSVQASTDLLTWDVETVPLTNTPSFFQVRPTVPIPQAKRQFFRLKISDP